MAGKATGSDEAWTTRARGPALVLAAAIAIELTTRFVTRIPNPPSILLLCVAYAAFRDGLRSGLVSSGVAWFYLTFAFSSRGHVFHYAPDDAKRVVLWAVATPGLALMIGTLRSRALEAERAAVREAEARFTRAFHASPVGLILSRASDGELLDVNAAGAELFGYARDEILGRSALDLGMWADLEQRAALVRRLRETGRLRAVDVTGRKKSGDLCDLLCSVELLGEGDDARLLSFYVDVTERRRAEQELRRREEQLRATQKMEAVGRLAGGIAHDFNNLLTVITGNAALLRGGLSGEKDLTLVSEISDASARAAALTRQLLAFSRQKPLRLERVDLGEAVRRLEPLLARTIGEVITLRVSSAADLGAVRADPGQIDQVITNLVINARDAMSGDGVITVDVGEVTLDAAAAARVGAQARAGRFVTVTVSDDGAGMSVETLEHVFEPFFTTKGEQRGTGLGLATVYGIVARAGGFIDVRSQVDKGTTFRLFFPRADRAAPAEADAPTPALTGGHERVMLVEDDPAVRALTARMLSELGYDVVVTDGPEDALSRAVLPELADVDLVLTDVVMPNVSGPELAKRIAPLLPRARILFFSGYAADLEIDDRAFERAVAFLPKPFTPEALAAAVRGVLDAP